MTGLLLAYYGDDFTGSADVMEVLQWSGLRTVLFLNPPTSRELAAFPDLRAFGVAGWSRTMSPAEMDAELRPVLTRLREVGPPIVRYKTCSTCDSSPEIGSIGKALEIGREVFGTPLIPIMIASPALGRYQVFGNLFARSGLDSEPSRLDRHPTMQRHPITPMQEADLRLHLGRQTRHRFGLVDVLKLRDDRPLRLDEDADDVDAVLFDALYPEHLPRIGSAIQRIVDGNGASTFVIGSSGIEAALTAYWATTGKLNSLLSHPPGRPSFSATGQLLAITGSCSPVNDRQIAYAERHGFEMLPLETGRLLDPQTRYGEIQVTVERALKPLGRGASLILHSSRGPDDPRVATTAAVLRSLGYSEEEVRLHSGRTLGPLLGKVLKAILQVHPMPRVAVAGGDTSGYIARELGITALEAIAPVAPGSPLCRAHADNEFDGVEFFFKGGQVGTDDVWLTVLQGTASG